MMKTVTKIFCTLMMCVFAANTLLAQKVEYEDNTILVDGKPYAMMKKKNVGPLRNDFIVSSLSGTELIYFKSLIRDWTGSGFKYGAYQELYYEANFTASGSQATLKHYGAKGFANLVVENNLVNGDVIDFEAERRFIQLNNGWMPSMAPAPTEKTPAVVVNINNNTGGSGDNTAPAAAPAAPKSKSPVTIDGNQIIRDGAVIGKFKQDATSSTYSQKMIIVVVYSEGGEKVAEAFAPATNPQEWNIKTMNDNKTFNILYDAPNEKEKLFKWLADKNYLVP